MAVALQDGRLHRNFQGYTTDASNILLGFGASAIGHLPQGYVQNEVHTRAYTEAIASGRSATVKGYALTDDDRLRADSSSVSCATSASISIRSARGTDRFRMRC
jgi:oxygen-independent coproporphyrinogen-3 oxidase